MENPLQKENQYTTRPGGQPTPAQRTTHLPKETPTSVRCLIAPPNFTPLPSTDDMVWTPNLVKSLQQAGLIGQFPLNFLKCMLPLQSAIIQKSYALWFLGFHVHKWDNLLEWYALLLPSRYLQQRPSATKTRGNLPPFCPFSWPKHLTSCHFRLKFGERTWFHFLDTFLKRVSFGLSNFLPSLAL
jgi:hypothetical protein